MRGVTKERLQLSQGSGRITSTPDWPLHQHASPSLERAGQSKGIPEGQQ